MIKKALFCFFLIVSSLHLEAKLPVITSDIVVNKMNEIMKAHATQRNLTPTVVRRTLTNYIDNLDPNKTFFIKSDIQKWIEPSDAYVKQILSDYEKGEFAAFEEIHAAMVSAILRKHVLEKEINLDQLPKKVNPKEFKNNDWAAHRGELLERIKKYKSLEVETYSKLDENLKEKALQRLQKYQASHEENLLNNDPKHRQQVVLANVLKASASALDSQTSYFTPDEAEQFMIGVQQRLFGIGAQLRDDINGFSIVKIIEGGPAADGGDLKLKDRIIAVDGEPVIGKDIIEAVELIRGPENTNVKLTVIRESEEEDGIKREQKVDINIMRGEVVLKETRYESNVEPYGDGAIAYLRLFSFYEDPEHSSANDLRAEIERLKKEHDLKGLILDLRYNSGGLLSQAVGVTGLFITKGVVVGIKDNTDKVQYLRNIDGKMAWDGPLVVLVNRASASASEIVAQTLQDYGRALIVGDETTYGKGSFQTFTLSGRSNKVNPEGEYKVTRGIYYTVSGKSPQLRGVVSDIVVPGVLSEMELGEQYTKFPLENSAIKPNFDDDLSDIPYSQRQKIRFLYKFNLQKQLHILDNFKGKLVKNSTTRIENNKNYQNFLKELKRTDIVDEDEHEEFGKNDLQLIEAYNITKDLIQMSNGQRFL